MGRKLICCFVEVPTLNGEAHAQRNDFKWAHIEVDGPPVVGEHWCRTVGRLFQQIDLLDVLHRTREAKDEPFSVFGPFEAAERERQSVDREEVIHTTV